MNIAQGEQAVHDPATAASPARPQASLRSIFLDEPPGGGARDGQFPIRKAAGIAALVLLLTFARRPDLVFVPQFWADDGTAFYQQAMDKGFGSFFVAHGGYYHTVIRIAALIGAVVPVRFAPHWYFAVSVAVLLFVSCVLFSPRLPIKYPTLMALCLGLVPHGGEVYLVLCNIHFYFALLLVLILISDPPESKRQYAFDTALLVLLGLTGPFSLIFFPLFAWRAVREKAPALKVRALLIGVTAAIQLTQVLGARAAADASRLNPENVLEILGRRLLAPLVMGPFVELSAPGFTLGIFAVVLLAFLALALWVSPNRKPLYFFAAALSVIASALFVSRAIPESLYNLFSQDRFFFPPLVLTMWCLVQALDSKKWAVWPSAVLLLVAGARTVGQPQYHIFAMQNLRWAESSRCIGGPTPCTVPINPLGRWFVVYEPEKR